VTELTAYNTDQVVVQVEEGTLVIFPAWLVHSVDPNRSGRPRISASFNAMFSAYAETMGEPMWGET
jgi:ectoine hydroxylase-related dioxygenase (phytanoyl-CoA dioxygenase family)